MAGLRVLGCSVFAEYLQAEQLLEAHPLLGLYFQHAPQDIPDILGHPFRLLEFQRLGLYVLQNVRGLTPSPGQALPHPVGRPRYRILVVEHVVQDQPQRPDLGLLGVGVLLAQAHLQQLGREEQGGPHEGLELDLAALVQLGSAEIGDFDDFLVVD